MILSPEEKAANRAAFHAMNLGQKAEYIFAYYKLPLVIALVIVVAFVSIMRWVITHKDPVLYVAYANVAVPEELDTTLTSGFLEAQGIKNRRSEVYCYHDLYLATEANTANHQYAYASKLKTLAAVDAEQLDVVLMNQEAVELLSASGYLLDLSDACTGSLALPAEAQERLAANVVVLSDNRIEVELNEADEYVAETEEVTNALRVDGLPLFADFPEDEPLYLGIIANTPRLETSVAYLMYVVNS